MKPYYLKNAGEYHSRLTTKLAALLLALPICGAFAAVDNTVTLKGAASATGTAVAFDTASKTNELTVAATYTGYAGASTDALTYTAANTIGVDGTAVDAVVGATVSSVALTVSNGAIFEAGAVTIGLGWNSSTSKLATSESNAVTLDGGFAVTDSTKLTSSQLTATSLTVGKFGSKNSLTIKGGAALTTGALSVGIGDLGNDDGVYTADHTADTTLGASNSVAISGYKTATLTGGAISTVVSHVTSSSIDIGSVGSSNTLDISGGAYVANSGAVTIGTKGSSNKVTVDGTPFANVVTNSLTGSTLTLGATTGASNSLVLKNSATATFSGAAALGLMPASTGNEIDVDGTLTIGEATTVGTYGSSNKIVVTGGKLVLKKDLVLGVGDDQKETKAGANDAADGTAGYVATEGNSNSVTVSGASSAMTIASSKSVTVGSLGSLNSLVISDGADVGATAPTKNSDNEYLTTGFTSLTIGAGNSGDDFASFGSNNFVTVTGATSSVSITGDIKVGSYGNGNKLTLSDGAFLGAIYNQTKGTVTAAGDLTIGTGNPTNFKTTYGNANSVLVDASKAAVTNVSVGEYGSSNTLTLDNKGDLAVTALVIAGVRGQAGSIASGMSNAFSESNSISLAGASSLTITSGKLSVGELGTKNSLSVTEGSVVWVKTGLVALGLGGSSSVVGYGNTITVSGDDSRLVVSGNLYIGGQSDANATLASVLSNTAATAGSGNELTIVNGGIVVANGLSIDDTYGDDNYIMLKGGYLALLGKSQVNAVVGVDANEDGDYVDVGDSKGLIQKGIIQVYDNATGEYKTATLSDVTVKYYSSEDDAKAATGYAGLAGYTVITAGENLSRLAWAGTVYSAGSNVYCSSWYGWFYNDAAYGNYIMSYEDYSWQYVDPTSTAENAYFYDYSLGAWIYTSETNYKGGKKWVYNYATGAWQKLGE